MKLVGWVVYYRARRGAWWNTRRMSYTEARRYRRLFVQAGCEARLVEMPLARWIKMPLRKKVQAR